jgi:hypothetical protein
MDVDPKFASTIDWNKFASDENYRKLIVGRMKQYEAMRNDKFYSGRFGDAPDNRVRSPLTMLLSGKNEKGEDLTEAELKALINKTGNQIEKSSAQINENMERNRLWAKSSMISQFLGLDADNRDYADKMKDIGVDPNADVFTQLTAAADMGKKMQVINANIQEIVKAPRNMMFSVIKSADKVMYDFFFGKDTGVKDKNGKEIKGLFNRMSFEMGKTMETLNDQVNDIFANKDDWLNSLNDTINNWFGIDIKKKYREGRQYIRDKVIDPVKENLKKEGTSTWEEIRDSVTGTIDDVFKTNLTGKLAEQREKAARDEEEKRAAEVEAEAKEKAEEAANNAGQAAAGDYGISGKTFLSKNELLSGSKGLFQVEKPGLYDLGRGKYNVIPGSMNPFISSASRSAYSVEANKQNENRMRSDLVSRLENGDSKLAAALNFPPLRYLSAKAATSPTTFSPPLMAFPTTGIAFASSDAPPVSEPRVASARRVAASAPACCSSSFLAFCSCLCSSSNSSSDNFSSNSSLSMPLTSLY